MVVLICKILFTKLFDVTKCTEDDFHNRMIISN